MMHDDTTTTTLSNDANGSAADAAPLLQDIPAQPLAAPAR
jgi:hypothetical protein